MTRIPADSGDGLAAFVTGLPEGQRHKGFFWAAATAAEDGLPPAEVAKVEKAGIVAGLDPAYVRKTLAQVHDKESAVAKQILKKKPRPKPKPKD